MAALAVWWLPQIAHACPMCFSGGNQNQIAFLYGSLFLIFVPVTALLSLAYWVWRRACALEQPPMQASPEAPEQDAAPGSTRVLEIARR